MDNQKQNGDRKKGGRPKGVPNKVSGEAKEAIALAAEGLGGVFRLIDWVKEDPANEKVFWSQMYTKLVPLRQDSNVSVEGAIEVITGVPRDEG